VRGLGGRSSDLVTPVLAQTFNGVQVSIGDIVDHVQRRSASPAAHRDHVMKGFVVDTRSVAVWLSSNKHPSFSERCTTHAT
jgi:hypothetical protein